MLSGVYVFGEAELITNIGNFSFRNILSRSSPPASTSHVSDEEEEADSMNRVGNKGTLCPLFCCLFGITKCCCCCAVDSSDDEDDPRRALLRKHNKYYRHYNNKRTKPRDINKQQQRRLTNSGRFVDPCISQSPIIHSGLKRLPFNGTLSDLTERSEEEQSNTTSSMNLEDQQSFQFEEPALMFSGMEQDTNCDNSFKNAHKNALNSGRSSSNNSNRSSSSSTKSDRIVS